MKSREILFAHCRSKPGVVEAIDLEGDRKYSILNGPLDFFARVPKDGSSILLRCSDIGLSALIGGSLKAEKSEKMQWETEGWTWIEVHVDVDSDDDTILQLLDDSYELLYNSDSFGDDKRNLVSLVDAELGEQETLERLITHSGLNAEQGCIVGGSQLAIQLLTTASSATELPLGASRLGGCPDLPADFSWPTHPSGRPLSFLGQLKLSEMAKLKSPLSDTPGTLYFFSAWGWLNDEGSDPDVPEEEEEQQVGWTRVVLVNSTSLVRRTTPDGAFEYGWTRASPIETLSVPTSTQLQAAQHWDGDKRDTLDWKVTYPYYSVLEHKSKAAPRHLLFGFPNTFQFDAELPFDNPVLLMQLASDDLMESCFGDGGSLYFYIAQADLDALDFSRVRVDYQS